MVAPQNGSYQNGHANGTDSAPPSSDPVKVIISGAGPAGLLLAHYLLSFGKDKFRITIYDKAEDPRETQKQTLNYRRYRRSNFIRRAQRKSVSTLQGTVDFSLAVAHVLCASAFTASQALTLEE